MREFRDVRMSCDLRTDAVYFNITHTHTCFYIEYLTGPTTCPKHICFIGTSIVTFLRSSSSNTSERASHGTRLSSSTTEPASTSSNATWVSSHSLTKSRRCARGQMSHFCSRCTRRAPNRAPKPRTSTSSHVWPTVNSVFDTTPEKSCTSPPSLFVHI